MNTQFKKGVLELCVLALLKQRDSYGYELAERISSCIQIAEGTLYPILRKLKTEVLCETYLSEQSAGPPRKYYRLTGEGMRAEWEARRDWLSFTRGVNQLMEEKLDENE